MRFVVKYAVGDGCTWSSEVVLPVEYESAEALYVDFETAVRSAQRLGWRGYQFEVAGHEFDADDFLEGDLYTPPEILTVDEWFMQYS
jgi:hypothetical protein